MDKNSAILYRRGLFKEDFKKNTLTLQICNKATDSKNISDMPFSIASLINSAFSESGDQLT